MNRFLPVLSLLGAFIGTASAAPYVLPSPQTGALTPYDCQPVYAIEGLYSIADEHKLPDTWGVRGSFNLYNSGMGSIRHQFNVNLAATWGSDKTHLPELMPITAATLSEHHTDLNLFLMPVTMGYNLNIELRDDVLLYLGGKAGYAWSHTKIKLTGTTWEGENFYHSRSHSKGGFTFSVGAGIKIQCSDAIYAHAGYEFGRSYLDYKLEGKDIIYGSHSIFLGVGCVF